MSLDNRISQPGGAADWCVCQLSCASQLLLFSLLSPGKMFLVGLTGGIASGKSSVIQVFQQLGCAVIDVDVIARHGKLGEDRLTVYNCVPSASIIRLCLFRVFRETDFHGCIAYLLPWRLFCLLFFLLKSPVILNLAPSQVGGSLCALLIPFIYFGSK